MEISVKDSDWFSGGIAIRFGNGIRQHLTKREARRLRSEISMALRSCPYCRNMKTADCGNPYQHMEKNRLLKALMHCHDEIDRLRKAKSLREGQ